MWLATRENGRMLSFSTTKANNDYFDPDLVLVLPADPASRQAMVERMRVGIGMEMVAGKGWQEGMAPYEHVARAALDALVGRKGK